VLACGRRTAAMAHHHRQVIRVRVHQRIKHRLANRLVKRSRLNRDPPIRTGELRVLELQPGTADAKNANPVHVTAGSIRKVKRQERTMPITEYTRYFVDDVRESATAVFHNGDIYPNASDTVLSRRASWTTRKSVTH
jgi:hypothetical protein